MATCLAYFPSRIGTVSQGDIFNQPVLYLHEVCFFFYVNLGKNISQMGSSASPFRLTANRSVVFCLQKKALETFLFIFH